MGNRSFFLGVKQPGREVDHSPPSSVEDKNALSYTNTPPTLLHGVVASWSTGQFYFFTFTLFYMGVELGFSV
jgi:hypothetical protein